jgi:hypothetical protein
VGAGGVVIGIGVKVCGVVRMEGVMSGELQGSALECAGPCRKDSFDKGVKNG